MKRGKIRNIHVPDARARKSGYHEDTRRKQLDELEEEEMEKIVFESTTTLEEDDLLFLVNGRMRIKRDGRLFYNPEITFARIFLDDELCGEITAAQLGKQGWVDVYMYIRPNSYTPKRLMRVFGKVTATITR